MGGLSRGRVQRAPRLHAASEPFTRAPDAEGELMEQAAARVAEFVPTRQRLLASSDRNERDHAAVEEPARNGRIAAERAV